MDFNIDLKELSTRESEKVEWKEMETTKILSEVLLRQFLHLPMIFQIWRRICYLWCKRD